MIRREPYIAQVWTSFRKYLINFLNHIHTYAMFSSDFERYICECDIVFVVESKLCDTDTIEVRNFSDDRKNPCRKSGKSVISVLINQKYEDLFHKIPSGYPYVLWIQGQTKYLETNFSLDVHILPQWDLCMWPLIALMIFRMILHECRVLTQMSVSVATLMRGHEVCRILLTPINY